jgi:hypothetical protein
MGEPELALAFMPAGLTIGGDEIDGLKLHFADRYMKTSYSCHSDGKICGRWPTPSRCLTGGCHDHAPLASSHLAARSLQYDLAVDNEGTLTILQRRLQKGELRERRSGGL